jgi:hypothetical protein
MFRGVSNLVRTRSAAIPISKEPFAFGRRIRYIAYRTAIAIVVVERAVG